MLAHSAPLKVAETFRVLEALFPGRIDLAIGRAPGSDQPTAAALQPGPGTLGIEYFPNPIDDLLEFLAGVVEPGHSHAGVRAMPTGPDVPKVWRLGSSDHSAAYAAHFGCAFSFAHFITDQGGPEAMRAYREFFRPSRDWRARLAASASSCCTPIAKPRRSGWRRAVTFGGCASTRGFSGPFPAPRRRSPTPTASPSWRAWPITGAGRRSGRPSRSRRSSWRSARHKGVDEFVVGSICHDVAARRRSYELLAQVFELRPAPLRADVRPRRSI
ncbi:MAG: LLM class flavin-dependent oxidoreductase [Pseudomonadota bacterium]